MKNIVLSANTSWYLYNFRSSTILALQKQGYNLVCLSPHDEYSQRLVNELGCKWIEVKMDNQGSNPIKDLIFLFRLFKVYRKIKPVAVFNFTIKNNIYGTWAARAADVRAINNVSGLGTTFITDNLTSKIVRLLYKLSQPFAYKVFCQNPEDYDLLIDKRLVAKEKLELLPGSGVNVERFSPFLKKTKSSSEPFVFLYVGRMLKDKGVLELIEAAITLFDKRQDFILQLCGFADSKNVSAISERELENLSSVECIEWLGPSDSIHNIYSGADCVVLPSYREGMPRTLLEAGAMGIPCIATNVPGCKHVITNNLNGYLCDAKSVISLIEAMETMLGLSRIDYQSMCKKSRSHIVDNFNEEIVVGKTLEALD
ncbi:glycosyltransferase family 4 protein [Vibrio pelagius]|uniref:glycosyltransferase family 4 protein n=1 Tax=Vibrio pelagius TaxID=28169 RepID=UPI00354FAA86